jgi:hypothetical protein
MSAEDIFIMSKKEQKRAEILALLAEGSILQAEAAERLGLNVRHVRRLQKVYMKSGAQGLISKKRGALSNNQISSRLKDQVIKRIQERYPDFGPTLAHEKLAEEDGFRIALSTVRKLMINEEIWRGKTRKESKIYPRRERRSRYGELIQIDGSLHDWFEGRGPKCCLIVFIDDATSAVMGLRFVKAESTFAYFKVVEEYLKEHGIPTAFYSDKHGIFRVNQGCKMESSLTEFGRAMKDLGIRTICAHSPQAKGRVERMNGTLQDRLVKELRLQNISTIEDANNFLPKFRMDLNRRFAVAPKKPNDAHITFDTKVDLERILSIHETRSVSKTLSFQFDNVHYQILEEGHRARVLIKEKIQIVKTMKGPIRIFYSNRELTYTKSELLRNRPKTLDEKELNTEFERWLNKKEQHHPSKDHPYKRFKS